MKEYLQFINGEWVGAADGGSRESLNPFNGEVVARYPWAGSADADAAIQAARRAFDGGWGNSSPAERAKLLNAVAAELSKRKDDFARLETEDSGSILRKSLNDVGQSVVFLRHFARLAEEYPWEEHTRVIEKPVLSANMTVREPLGVCAQIIPWNYPLMMAVWKLAPAIAAGNTVALKAAPDTPCSAFELAKIFESCGCPPGVVNVICGGAEAGEAMVKHPLADKAAFTGSTAVGRRVMELASGTIKRVTLELGGKSAAIVLPDADLRQTVDGVLFGAFYHAGQSCESGTRALVHESVMEPFLARLRKQVESIRIGDPASRDIDMGPLISRRQQERVLGYIETGKAEGAKLLCGGGVPGGDLFARGCFVSPTVFHGVKNSMTIAREEIFGPVLCVIPFRDEQEAIAIANDSSYGLAGTVWTRDNRKALKIARAIRAGMVWINDHHLLHPDFPFGGYKQSGLGREFGRWSMDAYTEVKHIHMSLDNGREKKPWYDILVRDSGGE
ncbi:MAG: Betaine aldehyde dehydrogenase [Myxococcota bacterium]|nr:Betaine aldehyde dehydrogenase [Myxococcota bacterium]